MNVLSQFTSEGGWPGLKDYIDLPDVYAAGRLDRDSEGLLLLTDNGRLQARLTQPRSKIPKTYMALVEGTPSSADLEPLRRGLKLKDGPTRPAEARVITEPSWLWPRTPPVRTRKTVKDSWVEITLTEGRNRQVRRMCAAIGYPCLRLIRWRVGPYTLSGIETGTYREVPVHLMKR